MGIHATWISHLLFADDSMIFMQANKRSADRLACILDTYHRGSGQLVNRQKSAVFFSTNTGPEMKQMVQLSLGIEKEALGEKYLGLPTAVGRVADGTFDYSADRIRNFIHGWGANNLSYAGRELLLKANAQAVPTYPMSCFKLPAPVCKKMKSHISNYWWGSSVDSNKIHWQRWSKLTTPKGEGGMGFRDLPLFNEAMLGKQGWRLITRPDSLCARVLKGKYYPNGDFLSATRKKKSSETWRAILHGRKVLQKGIIKRVGPGDTINIWNDNWIPGIRSMKPLVHLENSLVQHVDELFLPGTRTWDEDLVRQSFIPSDANEILKIRPGLRMDEDTLAWSHEKFGMYTVRSAYRLLKEEQIQLEASKLNEPNSSDGSWIWKRLWKLKIPPKIRIFWWRVVHNFLPTKMELHRRHVEPEATCYTCGAAIECLFHIVFECPVARMFWDEVKKLTGIKIPKLHQATWVKDLLTGDHCSVSSAELIICGVWSLWTGRNARKHGKVEWRSAAAARHISSMLEDFIGSGTDTSSRQEVTRVRWSGPPSGWMKVNTDAAFSLSNSTGSTGAVLRDHSGSVRAAAARFYPCVSDALMAEALAVRDGLILAAEQEATRVVLETDNATVATLVRSDDGFRSVIAGVWHEIRELSLSFASFICTHVNQEGNEAAHLCARRPSASSPVMSWVGDLPNWLMEVANKDCNVESY